MKKRYFAPDMEIANIQIGQSLLSGSIGRNSEKVDPSNAQAPRYRGYDPDEEDEDEEEDW